MAAARHNLTHFCVSPRHDGTKCHVDAWRGNMTKNLVYSLHATCVQAKGKTLWFLQLRNWRRVAPYVRRKAPGDALWVDKGFVARAGAPLDMNAVDWIKPPGR